MTRKKSKKKAKRAAAAQAKATTVAATLTAVAAAVPAAVKLFQQKPSPHGQGQVKICPYCPAGAHMGDPASEKTLLELSPEAAVYFDRDVGDPGVVADLCGPRFRVTNASLYAHFGSPASGRYIVFYFNPTLLRWEMTIGPRDQREHHACLLSRHVESP